MSLSPTTYIASIYTYDSQFSASAAGQVQKSAQHYTDAARDEVKLLSMIRQGDQADDYNCVRLLDCFDHLGPHGRHVCLVFEVLGDNLLALIKHYDYRGIPLDVLQHMSRQVSRQAELGQNRNHQSSCPAGIIKLPCTIHPSCNFWKSGVTLFRIGL